MDKAVEDLESTREYREEIMSEEILDRIHIRQLRARCLVGINDWEREKPQEVLISITLHADLKAACATDDIAETINYKTVKDAVLKKVQSKRYDLVEHLAQDIADLTLADARVVKADVLVDKMGALRFANSVAVEISRCR